MRRTIVVDSRDNVRAIGELTMKKLLSLPILLFVITFAAAAFWPDYEARALPCQEVWCEWYSDATYTELVGWRMTTCFGVTRVNGQQTEFEICETSTELCPHCECLPPLCPF
jgi:hypothetical protein